VVTFMNIFNLTPWDAVPHTASILY